MHSQKYEQAILTRDCEAAHVPSGERGTIPEGTLVNITQSLGGSFTVYAGGNLFRVAGQDADALGLEPLSLPELAENATEQDVAELVWAQMSTCYDPEIPVNIVDLGLVYDCKITTIGDQQRRVDVQMTLTAPGCGMGDIIADDVRSKIMLVPTVTEAHVEVVFDPPWGQDRMTDAAKLETGLM